MKSPSKNRLLSENEATLKLCSVGQEHLLRYWDQLNDQQKQHLTWQITHLDLELFQREKAEILKTEQAINSTAFSPFTAYCHSGNQEDIQLGTEMIKAGKVALLVLAGGQGSRLRCKGPKGCFAITNVAHKSLYQLVAEKVKAAGMQVGVELEMAVMTSPLNHVETQTFFAQHAFFGLHFDQITFFHQLLWPLLNFEGNLFLEEIDQIAQGPNGNGGVFRRLVELGIWEKWHKKGIEIVHVIPIDNPLAMPFDSELLGLHARGQNDVTIQTAAREDSTENVGVLATVDGKATIVEYLDLSEKDKAAKNAAGRLKFDCANLGIYSFSLSFIAKASEQSLHLHKTKKAVKELGPEGKSFVPDHPNAWKFEEFIFDVLPFADRVQALLCPRSSCFAPLKNLTGKDSMDTVRAALLAFDRQVFAQVTGYEPPTGVLFELAPQFYYPTAALLAKWKDKPCPRGYIDE